jgi:hypothetical protein
MLGTLAFAQQASAGAQPAQAGLQVAPAAQAQLAPAAQAQVSPAARVQVSPAAKPQVSTAHARWQGVQPNRLRAEARFASVLRAQGIGL